MRISDRASVSVDGQPTNPCHVIAGPSTTGDVRHDIQVEIDPKVVLHELQQCGVNVVEDTLRDFVAADATSEAGRTGYLTFARFVIRPVPPLPGARHAITPKWTWVETSEVALDEGVIKLSGRCIAV
jgi:hypothetical protein